MYTNDLFKTQTRITLKHKLHKLFWDDSLYIDTSVELHLMPVVMRAELMEEDMDGAGAQAGQAGPQDDGDAAEYNNEESGKTQHSDQQEGTQEIRSEFPESWIFTDAQIG